MDMIKKIAITASTMLFVLTQFFSFYVIYTSHQEKIELIAEDEKRMFEKAAEDFRKAAENEKYERIINEQIITYFFRKYMMENTALFRDEKEIYNKSPYEFDTKKIVVDDRSGMPQYMEQKLNDAYIILFYYEIQVDQQDYCVLYVKDITYIYMNSKNLAIREIIFSILIAFAMALLLVFLIKKITKPLQAVNEAQRQLIGSMSHELKTPLTAISGYSEMLLDVKLSKEQEKKALNYINTESGRLSRLSEKMMELTRLYEPECRITLQETSVEVLFENVKESVKHRLEEKEITLIEEGSYHGKSMMLDMDLMTSFLINLINNSTLASKHGSRIYLGGDGSSLWVRDEGCGIPPEEVDKVRKAFYRVDKSRSRKSGNMGLGLALCDQIAKVHHGEMKIESEVGKGTKVLYQSFTNG